MKKMWLSASVALLMAFSAQAGLPDQDEAVAQLRQSFINGKVVGYSALTLQRTYDCLSRSAVIDNYVMSFGEMYPIEVMGGILRIRYSFKEFADQLTHGLMAANKQGLVLNDNNIAFVLRQMPSGELIGEVSGSIEFGEDKAPLSAVFKDRLAILYTVCRLR